MECLGLHNKPKARLHPGHKLTDSKEEEEEEEEEEPHLNFLPLHFASHHDTSPHFTSFHCTFR
jgi:hypothetical protein